jgi:membrane peptidoglycan carboxypeptidase
MITPGTGSIVAMAQNRTWGISGDGKTSYNYNADRSMGGTIGMQSGSTFKAFVLAAAIEQGIPASERMFAPGMGSFLGFSNCTDGAKFPEYVARNAHLEGGIYNMRTATARSINTYFVGLEQRTGICRPAEIAEALGMQTGNGANLARVPSFTLGANEVSPMRLANAYATFAAHGLYCEPRAILDITDRDGNHLPVPPMACNQVIQRKVADGVTELLHGVIEGNLYGRTGAGMSIGRDSAGKTGTTNNSAAVWFAGYTPDLAAAVWVGDPRGGYKHPMENVTINGKHYKVVYGATLPGPIWKQSMMGALKGKPKTAFDLKLPSSITGVKDSFVCPTIGPIPPTATPIAHVSYPSECTLTTDTSSETTPNPSSTP